MVFEILICQEETLYSQIDLSVGKISGRNTTIPFLGIYHGLGYNSSKIAITLEERPKGTCPFGVVHISLGSTLFTKSELKSDVTLGNGPSPDA